jgi:hypothetical protein
LFRLGEDLEELLANNEDNLIPLRVKFEIEPGKWAVVLEWERGERVLDWGKWLSDKNNFYTVSVGLNSVTLVDC